MVPGKDRIRVSPSPPYFRWSRASMNTVQMYVRVNPKDMAYVKFIVESYEGLAVLRTVDPKEGILEWMIPPDLVEQAK
jgi:hypothetical protein